MDNFKLDFKTFAAWIFYALLGFLAYRGVSTLDDVSESINKLNQNVAVVISNMEWHKGILDDHEVRLNKMEDNNN